MYLGSLCIHYVYIPTKYTIHSTCISYRVWQQIFTTYTLHKFEQCEGILKSILNRCFFAYVRICTLEYLCWTLDFLCRNSNVQHRYSNVGFFISAQIFAKFDVFSIYIVPINDDKFIQIIKIIKLGKNLGRNEKTPVGIPTLDIGIPT